MTFAALQEALHERFRTGVSTPQTLTTVRDNAPEPTGIAVKWCRLRTTIAGRQQTGTGGLGARRYRTSGTLIADLHAPGKQGVATLNTLVDAILVAFTGEPISTPDIAFRQPPHAAGEVQDVAGWARRTVNIPFQFDEVE